MSFFVNLILIHLSRMFLLLYFYLTWFLFVFFFFFFNDTATTEIYTLSLHDALPISIVRAVRWFHPRLSILHFDAHPDLYPEFEGDRYSHACPFARILEERLADQVVQVGIRTMNAVQRAQAERHGVEVIDMRAWVEGRRPTLREPVYVSIDVDAFDPAFAPGVSHREPGGLTAREVLTVLHRVSVPLVGADIVEFNPAQDPSGMTATLCAKLVKEIAGKMT